MASKWQRQAKLLAARSSPFAAMQKARISSSGPKSAPISAGVALAVGGGAAAAVVAAYNGVVPHEWVLAQISDPVVMPLVRLFDPETAHVIAVKAAALGLVPRVSLCQDALGVIGWCWSHLRCSCLVRVGNWRG